MRRPSRPVLAAATVAALTAGLVGSVPTGADAADRLTQGKPTAIGRGGAVSTVDAEATRAGLRVLRRGGNAVDAAVAAAAALGVTEPFSAGIGGGGYFVYFDAAKKKVFTLDGRETAPRAMTATSFQENGAPIDFNQAVTSGLSVGVPGTPGTWARALNRWGTLSLGDALKPASRIARRGFIVDDVFRGQILDNQARFADFTPSRNLFLKGGQAPAAGSVFRNRDLARTYEKLGTKGVGWLYRGALGDRLVKTVRNPPVTPGATRNVRPGLMTKRDLSSYRVIDRDPTHISYRGRQVYGMAPSSSGGSTVGEALNILEGVDLGSLPRTQALHNYFEASALAYADRGAYVGDPAKVKVPLKELISQGYADERFCAIDQNKAAAKPVAAGKPDGHYDRNCDGIPETRKPAGDQEGLSTTHLVTSDRWGNVVSYTLTIEQIGGSGIVVPKAGFLLNNELTDFNFAPTVPGDPNLPAAGKRPRSSMSPTIVTNNNGKATIALGSPGGATIITTVLQTLINRIDFKMSLPKALAAPRASPRNGATVQAEPAFPTSGLSALGHSFSAPPNNQLGAAVGLAFRPNGTIVAAAEPVRRGGGSAGVVNPR